ncbi:MAG TPA: CHAT domain-containing protein, partial [Oculatellaceae cyanobacterium]
MTLDLQGQVYLAQGQPEVAAERFAAAATTYDRKGDKTGALKSRINEAQALRKGGFYRRALEALKQLNANLTDQTDPQLKAIALRSLGITQRLIGDLDDAKNATEESLKIAESLPSPAREENTSAAYLVLGNIAKDRANTERDRGNESEAQTQFKEAIAHYQITAKTASTPTARIEAQLNQLSVVGESGQPFTDTERELLRQVRETLDKLPLSRTAVHARINWARMVMELKDEDKVNPQDIAQQLAIALEQARKLKDQRSQSYALGQLGVLRQNLGQLEQAQENTKQALAIAQSIGAGDIAYRWQWQLGQILRQQGKTEGAIASYEAAVNNLQDLRGDLVTVNPDAQFSFREGVEPVYREYAGLLLQSNNSQDLEKARTAIESLQQAELVNFFRENCLTSKPVKIDDIDQKAAVIYPIVLADRLEVVLSLPGDRLKRQAVPKGRAEVNDIFNRLRRSVAPLSVNPRAAEPILMPKEGADEGYLELAKQVYDWIIRPFEEDIKASGVETLVFVLDGPLLNLPMAVLHDGEKFLVEKYAIALTPGLKLLDTKPLAPGKLTALKAGLSEARNLKIGSSQQPLQFSALPNVVQELKGIQSEVSGQLILNEQFTTVAIQQAIASVPFPIVHLATHGQFSSNAEETFILTSDDRLNINQLNQLLRGREEGGTKAIELLVLSACQTATGDERAALGLAGVAVKAGARSTLATLWVVNDEATAKLMIRFYEELKDTKISKAEALRRAQLWLMQQDSKYKQPDYWAPFVLVGNWL